MHAKVEHPFRAIKRQFGLVKVRFRGLDKNTAHLLTLFALSNLWMARKKLAAAHDRSVEAGMTRVFAAGPLGAVFGCVMRILLMGRRSHRPDIDV